MLAGGIRATARQGAATFLSPTSKREAPNLILRSNALHLCANFFAQMERIFASRQLRLHGIALNISRAVPKMIPISNQAVKIVPLPKGRFVHRSTQNLSRRARRRSFPDFQQIGQFKAFSNGEEEVRVVRHQDPGMLPIALAVKSIEDGCHRGADARRAKQALSVMLVEAPFNPAREARKVFLLLFDRPRLGIPTEPLFPFFFPLVRQTSRKSVCETKCDKVRGAW
jgi:hypothetical protein